MCERVWVSGVTRVRRKEQSTNTLSFSSSKLLFWLVLHTFEIDAACEHLLRLAVASVMHGSLNR